jgi:hypothetical protein
MYGTKQANRIDFQYEKYDMEKYDMAAADNPRVEMFAVEHSF